MITHIPYSTSRVAAAKSARMNSGMLAMLPFPPCNWAILPASAEAAGPGRPFAVSEEVILDRNSVIRIVPRITNPNTWVAAVGDDNYTAAVTPAEQLVGGRPLQLSLNEDGAALAQPRLVTDGDVKGGRYVSGTVDIYVGTGPAR